MAEVSDDKSLPYLERKRLQIEHAAQSSREAKLVKLADKLYNLRDLEKEIPVGWTEERAQQYFEWAAKVCKIELVEVRNIFTYKYFLLRFAAI